MAIAINFKINVLNLKREHIISIAYQKRPEPLLNFDKNTCKNRQHFKVPTTAENNIDGNKMDKKCITYICIVFIILYCISI